MIQILPSRVCNENKSYDLKDISSVNVETFEEHFIPLWVLAPVIGIFFMVHGYIANNPALRKSFDKTIWGTLLGLSVYGLIFFIVLCLTLKKTIYKLEITVNDRYETLITHSDINLIRPVCDKLREAVEKENSLYFNPDKFQGVNRDSEKSPGYGYIKPVSNNKALVSPIGIVSPEKSRVSPFPNNKKNTPSLDNVNPEESAAHIKSFANKSDRAILENLIPEKDIQSDFMK
jgi:hypothetical protein